MQTASEPLDAPTNRSHQTTVTEVWPGEFELRIDTGEDTPITTVHTFDATELEVLCDRIENSLDDAQ